MSSSFAYDRYLLAKRTVDDRALNKDVVERLRRELAPLQGGVLRVLEVGGGIGTMVARLLDWGVLRTAHYTLLDRDPALLTRAHAWLSDWARAAGYVCTTSAHGLHLRREHLDVTVTFREADIAQLGESGRSYDLMIANAVLDIVDVPAVLPGLLRVLAPRALYWFSCNFDGETIFCPEHPANAALLGVYHRSMDDRPTTGRGAGHSQTGQRLFRHLKDVGASTLAVGASDWIVFGSDGRYHADEAQFLRCIVQTIHDELRQHREVPSEVLSEWTALRLSQIERAELVYIAHQLDFLGRAPDAL
ncbi:MAG TPA: class I SAM-dependent methyltransferase [Polyangiaceae bacterium]